MLDKAANAGRAPTREHVDDCYDTDPVAVRALLKVEKLPLRIWEPCCGTGNIAEELRFAGHQVIATDLHARGCPDSSIRDFFKPAPQHKCDAIVTNPPFRLAEQFISLSMDRAPLVVMLLRLAFYESQRRSRLLDSGRLARIHVFANRLPMMHRDGFTGKKASSAIAFGWFIWSRDYFGPTTIDRIRWER